VVVKFLPPLICFPLTTTCALAGPHFGCEVVIDVDGDVRRGQLRSWCSFFLVLWMVVLEEVRSGAISREVEVDRY
jgi:hypothetical protein